MRTVHTLRRRSLAPAIPFLALLAVAVLGGCSVGGGVSGSIGEAGGHLGASVDFSIHGATTGSRMKQRYGGETAYVVPNYAASP